MNSWQRISFQQNDEWVHYWAYVDADGSTQSVACDRDGWVRCAVALPPVDEDVSVSWIGKTSKRVNVGESSRTQHGTKIFWSRYNGLIIGWQPKLKPMKVLSV